MVVLQLGLQVRNYVQAVLRLAYLRAGGDAAPAAAGQLAGAGAQPWGTQQSMTSWVKPCGKFTAGSSRRVSRVISAAR